MNADEVALLKTTVAGVVESADGPALTVALDEIGWIDLLVTEPSIGIPALFSELGRAIAWSSALHDVLASRSGELGIDGPLEEIAVVVPRPLRAAPGRGTAGSVEVEGLLLGAREDAKWLVAASGSSEEDAYVFAIPVEMAKVERRVGLDPGIVVQQVTATADPGSALARGAVAQAWWAANVANARRALSHQLCGVLAVMLELARTHAIERRQFGRSIAGFQAVRHKLAESHVVVVGAQAAVDMTWESDDEPLASMTAKLVSGQAFSLVAAHTQQVLAGIGFTAEHPYHLAMKRAVLVDRLFGDAHDLAPLVGRELVARGKAPRLAEL